MPPANMAPRKRPAATESEASSKAQKYQAVLDQAADEFVCPITQELPVDPVMAEDGRVYERTAIEDWLNRPVTGQIKSPVTNLAMGRRLLPALQIRNTIKNLVQSGALSGDKADAWKKAIEEEELVKETREKANAGDASAMVRLAYWYLDGDKSLSKDPKMAFEWCKKAADAGDASGLSQVGIFYLYGNGVARNLPRAFLALGEAAGKGSEHAMYMIGWVLQIGHNGVDIDPEETKKWYRKMATATVRNCPQKCRDLAAQWLRENP